jgi:hypothetical protein
MEQTSINYDSFNFINEQLLINLIDFLPGNNDLVLCLDIFRSIVTRDPKKMAHLFLMSMAEHAERIMNKDEAFFLEAADVGNKTNNINTSFLTDSWKSTFTNNWLSLTDEQKETVWLYLNKLLETSACLNDR